MSLINKENNESSNYTSKILKLNKDSISNTELKSFQISHKISTKKLLISKDKLKSLISDSNIYFRNNKLTKHKTKIAFLKSAPNKLKNNILNYKKEKLMIFNKKCQNYNFSSNINKHRKNENINIITNDINNYIDETKIDNISNTQRKDEEEILYNISFEDDISIINKNKYKYFDTYNSKKDFNKKKNNKYKLYMSKSFLALNNLEKKCRKKLLVYNINIRKYNIRIINDIISDQNKHIVSLFKNFLLWDDPSEYLKRYYLKNESLYRLQPIASYYISYTYFAPVYYCNLEIIKILLKNVKRKNNYYREIENFEAKLIDKSEDNSISSYFDDKLEDTSNNKDSSSNNKNNNNNDFVPLIDSSELKESQISSINKKTLSLSTTVKNYNILDNNLNKNEPLSILFEKDNKINKFSINRNNLFNIAITPIRKKSNLNSQLNEVNYFQNTNEDNKKDNNGKIIQDVRTLIIKKNENVISKYKDKYKYENKSKDEKKNNIKINKKNKKLKTYRTTDDMDILPGNVESNEVISIKKDINKKEEKKNNKKNDKNKELKNINNQKNILNSYNINNNFDKKSSNIFNKKNNLKKLKINNESKKLNSINYLTQRNQNLNESNKLNNIFNRDYSLILRPKNKEIINSINNKNFNIKKQKNLFNIIYNLNKKLEKKSQYKKLLTSIDRKNNFSIKKNIEFSFRFHSLSSNRKKILKISDSHNSNSILKNIIPTTIYFIKNNNNSNSLLKKKRQTLKNTSKKHKKGKSGLMTCKKKNNLTINTNLKNNINKNILNELRKNNFTDNKIKIGSSSSKNKIYIRNIIDNFKNNSYRETLLKSKNNNNNHTFKNIITGSNLNNLIANKSKRKCKSKSPTLNNNYKKIFKIIKTKPKLKFLNSIFSISNKILNEINNNNNYYNNIFFTQVNNSMSNNENEINIKSKVFNNIKIKKSHKDFNCNNEYIKTINPRVSSLYNMNLSLSLNNQHSLNKNHNINIIENRHNNKNKNKYIIKNSIKSSKIIQIKEKKIKNFKSIDKLKTKKNTNNKNSKIICKINNTNNNTKHHYKKFSTQINQEKNIINKNIIKKGLKKRKSLYQKNVVFSNNISNNQSKNSLIKNFKKKFNSIINDDFSEFLTERKNINKDINITNSNYNLNSNSKDKQSNKYSYINYQNKNIYSLKNNILICKNKIDKNQNKLIEDKVINSFRNCGSKNCLHKKSLTNISSFLYDKHFKKNINEYKNIYKYNNRNNISNEFSLKKTWKSNYNEFILNHPSNSIINNNCFSKKI